ncbi:MAG: DUF4893 domain-containing protein [Pseudomonadota bacterium]|nr:DUF4893 domain-containing protein [Pseudomonadota bacterium]
MRFLPAAAAICLLSGCSTMQQQLSREGALIDSNARDWQAVATPEDRVRLRDWRSSFVEGLGDARRSGAGPKIAAEGALLAPDAALPGPAIPNGTYSCRITKLGARGSGALDYIAYPPFLCRVRPERGLQGFAKLNGSQRQVGLIFPVDALRSVFLGTLMLGDENRALQYGGDPDRDVAGYVERIGPRRWRMILPRPAFESKIDIIELSPLP